MDIDALKGATLDGEKFDQLKTHLEGLEGKLAQARKESIDGRKTLKERAEKAEALNARMFERLGIDGEDGLDALPDAKGQAEAAKQAEARIKRLERELADTTKRAQEIEAARTKDRRAAAIAQAVAKHNFIDADVAGMLLDRGLRIEGEQVLFEQDGGKLVPLEEGAAWLAKSKPHLVRAAGDTGSGYRPGNGSGQGSLTKRPERKDYADETAYFRDAARWHDQQQQQPA